MELSAMKSESEAIVAGGLKNYAGHIFDWKLLGGASGGAFALAEVTGWQGGEPPLHVHDREDEFFYVLDGKVTFKIGDQVIHAGPGGFVWAPRRIPHTFMFDTPTVRVLIGFLPAGQDDVFLRFSAPADRSSEAGSSIGDPDYPAIEAADAEAGVTYLGPPLRELLAANGASAN
jgi:quercetin dioxygenase-like cupin family protein